MSFSRRNAKFRALDVIRIWAHHLDSVNQETVVRFFANLDRSNRRKDITPARNTDLSQLVAKNGPQNGNFSPVITEEGLVEDFFFFDLLLKGKTKELTDALAGRKSTKEVLELTFRILRDIIP